jgi:predicted nucleic acid-binding Zn ribbon protein
MERDDRVTFCKGCGETLPWGEELCSTCRGVPALRAFQAATIVLGVLVLALVPLWLSASGRGGREIERLEKMKLYLERKVEDHENRLMHTMEGRVRDRRDHDEREHELEMTLDEARGEASRARGRIEILEREVEQLRRRGR